MLQQRKGSPVPLFYWRSRKLVYLIEENLPLKRVRINLAYNTFIRLVFFLVWFIFQLLLWFTRKKNFFLSSGEPKFLNRPKPVMLCWLSVFFIFPLRLTDLRQNFGGKKEEVEPQHLNYHNNWQIDPNLFRQGNLYSGHTVGPWEVSSE